MGMDDKSPDSSLKAGLVNDAAQPKHGRSAPVESAAAGSGASGHRGSGRGGSRSSASANDHEEQNFYSSLHLEDEEPDAKLPTWNYRWMGRIFVLRLPCGAIYIGPHWYCCVIMLGFILGVGCFFMSSSINMLQGASGLFVTVLTTVCFLKCALANPGVIERISPTSASAASSAEQGAAAGGVPLAGVSPDAGIALRRLNSTGDRHCMICNVRQPRNCSHCDFCGVCIDGFDHHCPWMGKCIGKKNLVAFRSFICVSMTSLLYIFVSTVLFADTSSSRQYA